MKKYFAGLIILTLCSMFALRAERVDTIAIHSKAMRKDIKNVIITPDGMNKASLYPVLYLLHGYGGRYDTWINKIPGVIGLADQYQMIIVCPDGGESWYFDSPIDANYRYETYITQELLPYVDIHYNTRKIRNGRAIAGLSMGGHGALYLAFRHQDLFGACGSMSGCMDMTPFPNNWNIAKRLGGQAKYPERWRQNSVINMLHLLTPDSLKIMIDCGTGDFFYAVNAKMHEELLYHNIPHEYISRPGIHDRTYWSEAIKTQALFFYNYFSSAASK